MPAELTGLVALLVPKTRPRYPFIDRIGSLLAILLLAGVSASNAFAADVGDVNKDGVVDVGDATLLQRYLVGELSFDGEQFLAADVAPFASTGGLPDGVVDVGDLTVLFRLVSGELVISSPIPAPVLDPVPASTQSNPLVVTGSATASHLITIFVEGLAQGTVTADGSGDFSFAAALYDGDNAITAIASYQGDVSLPSAAEHTTYTNTLTRSYPSGLVITSDQVWTPGLPPSPYVVGTWFRVEDGATLTIQPGTTVQLDGIHLDADGTLRVLGTAAEPVTMTSANPGVSSWERISIAGENSVVRHAVVEWTSGGGGSIALTARDFELANTEIRNFATTYAITVRRFWDSVLGAFVGSSGTIEECLIQGDGSFKHGIDIREDADVDLLSNTFIEVGLTAIYVSSSTGDYIGNAITYTAPKSSAEGVRVVGNSDVTVSGNTIGSPGVAMGAGEWGVSIENSTAAVVGNTLHDWRLGIRGSSASLSVTDNTVLDTLNAIRIVNSANAAVADNEIRVSDPAEVGTTNGIELLGSSDSYVVSGNLVEGNGVGIFAENASLGQIIDNSVTDNSVAVELQAFHGQVADNTLTNVDTLVPFLDTGTGIELHTGSSPSIQGNLISGFEYGIRMLDSSSPTIDLHNDIVGNLYGVFLIGGGVGNPMPLPVINGNDIDNTISNLHVAYFDPTQNLIIDATGNWWGTTNESAIRSKITFDGDPPVIDFSDYLDGPSELPGTAPVPSTLFSFPVRALTRDRDVFSPSLGETVTVSFEVLAAASTIRTSFHNETDGTLVWDHVATYGAGQHDVEWNGRDNSGDLIPDYAYSYTVAYENVVPPIVLDRDRPSCPVPVHCGGFQHNHPDSYNVHRNEFYKNPFTVAFPLRLNVSMVAGGFTFSHLQDFVGIPGEQYLLLWDGRHPSDNRILDDGSGGGVNADGFEVTKKLKPDVVLTTGYAPQVSGEGTFPDVEVKATPYLVRHSYDQVSHLVYQVDQDADVTVKMLPAGIYDPADPNAVVLQPETRVLAAQPTTVAWRGHSIEGAQPGSSNDIQFSEEDSYTFTIEAKSIDPTGGTSLYRGILQMRR